MEKVDNAVFQNLFDLPEETLFTWYYCTWWKGIYRPGTLYLTDNLICFHSKLSQHFAIPFRDVAALERTWSRFEPASEISRLNAADGGALTVSADTLTLVTRACEGFELTHGRFDPFQLDAL